MMEMVRRIAVSLAFLCTMIAAVCAARQPQSNTGSAATPSATKQRLEPNGDIIVAASTRKAVRQRVGDAAGQTPPGMPLARYQTPVCVGVGGLSPAISQAIADRVMQDAEDVGLPLAGDDCSPNVMVLIVADPRDELRALAKRNHRALRGVAPSTVRDLLKGDGTALAWRLTEVRSSDGRPSATAYGPMTLSSPAATRIGVPIRVDVVAGVLLLDRRRVMDKTPQQLADYAAIRLLAGAREIEAGSLETILALFRTNGAAPERLTVFDRGYLHGLYAGADNARANTQKGVITHAILAGGK